MYQWVHQSTFISVVSTVRVTTPERGGCAVYLKPRGLCAAPTVIATMSASLENPSSDGKIPNTHSPLMLDGEDKQDKGFTEMQCFLPRQLLFWAS